MDNGNFNQNMNNMNQGNMNNMSNNQSMSSMAHDAGMGNMGMGGMYTNPCMSGMGMNPYEQPMSNVSAPQFTKYVICSVIQILIGCNITGIVALVLTVIANSSFKVQNFAEYQARIKSAKTALNVGWVLAVILYTLIIGLFIFSMLMAIATGA